MITLKESHLKEIFKNVASELVNEIKGNYQQQLDLLSPAQVCGLLDISSNTLDSLCLQLPKIVIVQGRIIRYRASDVAAFIESRASK